MENLLSKRQQESMWKKKRMIELRNEGLTYAQIHKELNKEIVAKGMDEISLSWVGVFFHRLKNKHFESNL